MSRAAVAAVALAFALDVAVREFPEPVHPVALYGRALSAVDREWARPRLAGVAVAAGGPLAAGALVAVAVWTASRAGTAAGAALAGAALFATTSVRMLLGAARGAIEDAERDPAAAREGLRALVGRETSGLSPGEVRSAAVESAAENLADGAVAPLLAFALLSPWLPLAAGGTAWVKAVNTNDSMLGYPTKPHGRASARLDDLVMWVPARLSAALIALAAGDPGAVVRAREWARNPRSPNSGWPMATLAAALGVRLEKPGSYALGAGALPTAGEARRGVRIVGRASALAVVGAGVVAWA